MKPLTKADYPLLKPFFEHQPHRLSTYSLASIIAWNGDCFESHYDIVDGEVIVATRKIMDHEDKGYLILPVGGNGRPAPAALKELVMAMGCEQICFVPGDYVQEVGESALHPHFDITEQKEYEDYLYLTQDLVELKGNKYAKKRNLIHQFTREYLNHNRIAAGMLTEKDVPECLDFLEKWCDLQECDKEQEKNMTCEKAAVIEALHTIEELDWRGLCVRVDGEVCAFAIMSHLTPDMGVLNFEKAYPYIKGLYQFLDNECARELFHGYVFMNKESDMGLAALAKSKKSYHPVEKLKSYCLTIKS
ncbi:MAG: DUF2156 domain-containing protein [Syntrophales bacterium]